jgi:hypothetical protein
MARGKADKLDDSINVPVPSALKRQVKDLASKAPGNPSHTAFARQLIEEGIGRQLQRSDSHLPDPQPVGAGSP